MLRFFYFLVAELVFCGSGQIIHLVGGLTLRMFNFSLAIVSSIYILLHGLKMRVETMSLFLFYSAIFFIGISFSLIGGTTENLFSDIKPLSFFFIFPFFYWMITSEQIVMNIVKIIKYCVVVMSTIYLIYLSLLKVFNIFDFYSLYYGEIGEESDFLFRGTGGEFFYKGFVYLPIGLTFFLQSKKYLLSFLILSAVFFTLTRGFYIISFLAIFLVYMINSSSSITNKFFVIIILFVISLFICFYFDLFEVGESRDSGDQLRILTIYQVLERITPFSFLFGHGFGNGVPIREVHMEMSYLEIFHKQGVLGLSFWMYFLYCIYKSFKQINDKYKGVGSAFFISAILVYVQSLFNPFLNNPIGMTAVILAYFSCNKLAMLSSD